MDCDENMNQTFPWQNYKIFKTPMYTWAFDNNEN